MQQSDVLGGVGGATHRQQTGIYNNRLIWCERFQTSQRPDRMVCLTKVVLLIPQCGCVISEAPYYYSTFRLVKVTHVLL